MKPSLANLSVAIRILIRLLIPSFFSMEGSSSNACFLESLLGVGVLRDPIVGRVLAAFCRGVAKPIAWGDAHMPNGKLCHPQPW